ncbi:response regulator [Paraglaciecola aquimarina]|uniref:Response regulator n=1 Tax=Paraglaciecola aquimarina TaxID=1235557 RepID=A0ABU3SVA2_9ALTE|nr:response regulator [Paraglaciecola aquimarina]MDU0353928.1 response regulator [Paraglaciecola aquimarina]
MVDDIEQNIELLSLLLKRNGHTVSEARDGEQALLQMQNNPIDLVLMDIQMPVMDGLTAAKKRRLLEQQNDWQNIPIIALTASVLPEDRKSAENAGMEGFANKPVDFTLLTNEMARVLNVKIAAGKPLQPSNQGLVKIDTEKGAALWGSKRALYIEVQRFIENNQLEIFALREKLTALDWATLSAGAHKFKGLTGNLALNSLMDLFGKLEQACELAEVDKCNELISDIETAFLAVSTGVAAMQGSKPRTEPVETAHAASSADDLLQALRHLGVAINNNEFDEELLDKLHDMRAYKPTEIQLIIDACNDFEFSRAATLVDNLIQSLGLET